MRLLNTHGALLSADVNKMFQLSISDIQVVLGLLNRCNFLQRADTSNFYFNQNLFKMLSENIFRRYLCTCISFFCTVPYHKTKNYFIIVGFVLLPCSQRDNVFEREHLFKHNIHFDINKNSKKIE